MGIIGGPKLAPRISPKKTWEGAAGGLATAMLTGAGIYALRAYTPDDAKALKAEVVPYP